MPNYNANPMAAFDEIAARIINEKGCTPAMLGEINSLRKLFEEAGQAPVQTNMMYVICNEEKTTEGNTVYVPVVDAAGARRLPNSVEEFQMHASENEVALQGDAVMGNLRTYGKKPVIVALPKETYDELVEQLRTLATQVYEHVDAAINEDELNAAATLLGRGQEKVTKTIVAGSVLTKLFEGNPTAGAALTEDKEIIQVTDADLERPTYSYDDEGDCEDCCGDCDNCDYVEDCDGEYDHRVYYDPDEYEQVTDANGRRCIFDGSEKVFVDSEGYAIDESGDYIHEEW